MESNQHYTRFQSPARKMAEDIIFKKSMATGESVSPQIVLNQNKEFLLDKNYSFQNQVANELMLLRIIEKHFVPRLKYPR